MSTASKPLPLNPPPVRKNCPVCGQTSYSVAGIHPQCAVRQADLKRLNRIKSRPVLPKVVPTKSDRRPWQKDCPKCRAVLHVRKKTCSCGHVFAEKPHSIRPST